MRRIITAGLALLAAGAATVLTGTPAQAVPGLSGPWHVSSITNGTDTKSVSVRCPEGTKPIGGGFFVSGGAGGRISVTRLQALSPSNTYAVTATEADDGAPGDWALHAYASCAPAPAGLIYVPFSTASNSSSSKVATATCPAGTRVHGTGARLLGDGGQVYLDDVQPSSDLTSVIASAYEDGSGYAGNWQLWAYAVCANPVNLSLQMADTRPADSTDDAVGVACPAGTWLHGWGGSINSATGRALFGGLYPNATLTTAVALAVEENGGFGGNWYTRVFAICAS
jgi:hypothetical protein